MTFRACFYPILGDYTWGWIGDLIDGFTIVVTVAGVCTSLGLGAIQIVDGLQYLGWADKEQEGVGLEVLSIWVITVIATASVISGLDAGIKFLSLVAFNLGLLLQFMVFVSDDTKFLMNLIVQEIGYFFQYSIFLLNFRTGAFAQLEEGQGRAVDGLAETQQWQNWWPVFYQAWVRCGGVENHYLTFTSQSGSHGVHLLDCLLRASRKVARWVKSSSTPWWLRAFTALFGSVFGVVQASVKPAKPWKCNNLVRNILVPRTITNRLPVRNATMCLKVTLR